MDIQWTQDLSVGIDDFDQQHRELFDEINALLTALEHGHSREQTTKMIAFLGNRVVAHFQSEESYMEQHGYPYLTAHRIHHMNFSNEFSRLRSRVYSGTLSPTEIQDIRSKLISWLRSHITNVDTMFTNYTNQPPLKEVA